MVPFDRYSAVLDACVMFPMIVRDVLLTLANHEFYSPKWSPRIRDEWTRNLLSRLEQRTPGQAFAEHVERIACATDRAFPDACVAVDLAEDARLAPVDAKDRHVVMTAVAAQCDAILTFNLRDFAAKHLHDHFQIEVLHPDDFVMDLIDLNEKRVVAAFRELLARKKNPPWEISAALCRPRFGCKQKMSAPSCNDSGTRYMQAAIQQSWRFDNPWRWTPAAVPVF